MLKNIVAMAVIVALGLGLCIGNAAAQTKLAAKGLQLDGSTTVGPVAEAFAEALKDKLPEITIKKTGSGDGVAALADKRCDIAMSSRFMKDSEFKAAIEKGVLPVAHAIAMDGVCIIINPANTISELSIEQIRGIYTGATTNWKQLGGPDMPIVAVSRDTSSGTYEAFNHFVMGKDKLGKVEYTNANPQVYNIVKDTKGAIGYVGLGFVDDKIKAVKVGGVEPTKKTIATGVYPLSRPLFLFTNGYPELGSPAHTFVTFYLSEEGARLVEKKGFVPLTNY